MRKYMQGLLAGLSVVAFQACQETRISEPASDKNQQAVSLQIGSSVPWTQVPGKAREIAVARTQIVYKVDWETAPDGFRFSRLYPGGNWIPIPGNGGNRLSAHVRDELWAICGTNSSVKRRLPSGSWVTVGTAANVITGYNDATYVLYNRQANGDYRILKWGGADWVDQPGYMADLAVSPNNDLWGIKTDLSMWKRTGGTGDWQQITSMQGGARDIAIDGEGTVFALGGAWTSNGHYIYRWNGSGWTQVSGAAVSMTGSYPRGLWVISANNNSIWWHEAP